MSSRRHLTTGLVALLLLVVGFAAGAGGSAWRARDLRAKPWRKILVEQEGTEGVTTRTRVIFGNKKVPLVGVEVTRTKSTFLSEWTKLGGFLNVLNDEKKKLRKFAAPYLKRDMGGHGLESVGQKVRWSGEYDGLICFTISNRIDPGNPGSADKLR